jgi:hypothetical protein
MLPAESDMSAVEELRLLKAQVSDLVRVCNEVARGDLCQKVTVPVHGVVMVQVRNVVNTMVLFDSFSSPMALSQKKMFLLGGQIRTIRQRLFVYLKKTELNGEYYSQILPIPISFPTWISRLS